MRYGKLYQTFKISQKLIDDTLVHVDRDKMHRAKVKDPNSKDNVISEGRTSSLTFINNVDIRKRWLVMAQKINKELEWDFDINEIEPLQYGEYAVSQEYAWHVDSHSYLYDNGKTRKISFSVFLNDDYEAGNFDLEIKGPMQNQLERCVTFKGQKIPAGTALFFQSDFWHRVRPVTKGVRKSLVGWVLGPKWK